MGGRRVDAAHRSKVPYWAHNPASTNGGW